jgi:16S rRNA (cytosine967-C5)-methyltransferase
VNAVLRRIAELVAGATNLDTYSGGHDEIPMDDGGAIRLPAPVFRGDQAERLAAGTSHPPGFVRALIDHFGSERARDLCLHSLVRPPTVVCTHYDADHATPTDEHLGAHDSAGHRVWTGDFAGLSALLAVRPRVWVQDAASSHAALGLAGRLAARGVSVPGVVVDLCAGRGTKTRQLSAEFPEAIVLASDTDEDRMKVLRDGASTTGGRIRAIDAAHLADAVRTLRGLRGGGADSGGGSDLVLLDVPCSNAGTLARRPEAKYRLASDQLARLIPLQREIMVAGAGLLAPGGVLVYSTCSIDQAENHDQAAWAASAEGPGLTLLDESQTLPSGLPGDPASAYRDGSYWAMLRKN